MTDVTGYYYAVPLALFCRPFETQNRGGSPLPVTDVTGYYYIVPSALCYRTFGTLGIKKLR